jgi:hypothetical protein
MLANASFAAVAMAMAVAGGCVTTYEDAPLLGEVNQPPASIPAASIAIPIGGPGAPEAGSVPDFYGRVLDRLQFAAAEHDLDQMATLLANYDRPDLPPDLAAPMQHFRAVAAGERWLREVIDAAKLAPAASAASGAEPVPAGQPDGLPPIGALVVLLLRLPAGSMPARLGGEGDADSAAFQVRMVVDDTFVDGSVRTHQRQELVRLPQAFDLAGQAVLELPIALELAAGDAVQRTLFVAVDILPTYAEVAGQRAPVRRGQLASASFRQWPLGAAAIAKAPMTELRTALQPFAPRQFARAFVAARHLPTTERAAAIDLLIEQVRFGTAAQAQVAMACLAAITGGAAAAGDRDGWLAWWQAGR